MSILVVILHALVCAFLILIILVQSGRGGGLTENFASAESLFGAKTSSMLVKTTTVLASFFLVTCLGLAVISSQKGRSLMPNKIAAQAPVQQPSPIDEIFKEEAPAAQEEVPALPDAPQPMPEIPQAAPAAAQ